MLSVLVFLSPYFHSEMELQTQYLLDRGLPLLKKKKKNVWELYINQQSLMIFQNFDHLNLNVFTKLFSIKLLPLHSSTFEQCQ